MVRDKVHCRLCSRLANFSFSSSKRVYTCSYCGFRFVGNPLNDKELMELYDDKDYKQFRFPVKNLESLLAEERIRELENFFNFNNSYTHILDFGCSDGLFLKKFKEKFPNSIVSGYDLATTRTKIGRKKYNLDLQSGDILNCYKAANFDLITTFHAIEHIGKPLEIAKQFNHLLKKEGYLVITTPNESFLLLKFLLFMNFLSFNKLVHIRKMLDIFYNDAHINSFSSSSIHYMLSKSGFRVVAIYSKERYEQHCQINFSPLIRLIMKIFIRFFRLVDRSSEVFILAQKS